MPEAYRNNRIIPQPDTIITQNRCPLVIAEYQSTIIDDHSIEKILVEMKLYSDACMEKKYIIAENFRTLGIIFSPKQLHLYVMQPHFVNVNNSVEKVYHEVYKVNVGDSRNLRDISQCIAILLFHLYEDGTDYTEVDTSGSIPRQNHKIKANEKTKPRETEDEIDAYTKTARWRRTKDNLPIEVYVLQKVLNNKHFVQIKNWKGLDTRYQVTMEKLRPLRFVKKSTRRKLSYMKNILSAIKILHSMKIIHGDVKTKNCMIREADGSAVLIDFDLCKIMTAPKMPLDKFENSFGTLGYIAPELEKREEYNELIDIYSCGIMFGEWIFENEYHRQEYEAKTDLLDDIERHRQSGIAEILKVIENMIADANTRISAEEALDRLCKIEDVI
jgi:serine/threonine protein kinase